MEISLGKRGVTRPGKRLQFANLKIAIEFVDLPIKMVIFHSYVSLPEEVGQIEIGIGRVMGKSQQPQHQGSQSNMKHYKTKRHCTVNVETGWFDHSV